VRRPATRRNNQNAALALVPIAIFVVMVILARR
jgi:hypothetical protein